jgi:response regulator RpfG family c-di-GMP phosphodiesterase
MTGQLMEKLALDPRASAGAPNGTADRPRILCVDDEPSVLEGLRDTLRRHFTVEVADSGAAALALLRQHPRRFAVVVSDMRMPGMLGSVFLSKARHVAPLATRILLTGHADADTAMRAVNDGQLFRFLGKPCGSVELVEACTAAVWQHRVVATERALLDEMLVGSVRALTEVLALARPPAFRRGRRAQELLRPLLSDIGLADGSELDAAAMLAHLGAIAVPAGIVEKLYAGRPLTGDEAQTASGVPAISARIVATIPRLEGVLQIIESYGRRFDATDREGMLPLGARALRIVLDFDALATGAATPLRTIEVMTMRDGVYDPELLATFRDGLVHRAEGVGA